jgi:diadenylate cyclase
MPILSYEMSEYLIYLDFAIVFFFVVILLNFFLKSKKLIGFLYNVAILVVFWFLGKYFNLEKVNYIFTNIIDKYFIVFLLVIYAPEIRIGLEKVKRSSNQKAEKAITYNTQLEICEAVFYLSSRKIGALITIENHTSLDQFANKAIEMNSSVSKELLINIFTPLTPLHDGAVIIRNDRIRCAAAYFVLSENNNQDKTMGSRHRAGLGISEISDSLTIIVSEQTGNISVATEGVLIKIPTKERLLEYINVCLDK